jgi:hypothetical protein
MNAAASATVPHPSLPPEGWSPQDSSPWPGSNTIDANAARFDLAGGGSSAPVDTLAGAGSGGGGGAYQYIMGTTHAALTAASFLPSLAGAAFSALDGGLYAAQGDWKNAGIALAGATLGVGLMLEQSDLR